MWLTSVQAVSLIHRSCSTRHQPVSSSLHSAERSILRQTVSTRSFARVELASVYRLIYYPQGLRTRREVTLLYFDQKDHAHFCHCVTPRLWKMESYAASLASILLRRSSFPVTTVPEEIPTVPRLRFYIPAHETGARSAYDEVRSRSSSLPGSHRLPFI